MPEERRVVTILFADVAGSTAFGESADPEDVRAVLGRYYAIAREAITEHGGTLEKFIGDAVMAIFGIPQAHGDDADRALLAALALRERVTADAMTSALVLRMGVNTGEVVASRAVAGGDFLVTGDAVNVAARLQQSAEPGEILVGTRTRSAVGTTFRFAAERSLTVKGKATPLHAAALEAAASPGRARPPFVGREPDLAQLELIAKRAFSERRPQLITITAPAGTGKSRLVEEFLPRLEDRSGRMTLATAQCLPYGSAVTYLPLRGLARALLELDRDDDLVPPLRVVFERAGHASADAARLTDLVRATLGEVSDGVERDRDALFGAWRLLVETLAADRPVVVVFEDLHWASDSLLDLVEHVTLPRTSAPLLMFALARPELLDRRPHWGGGRRNFTSLGLEPLTADETGHFIDLLTEGIPAAVRQGIVERAEGTPFFAGELVRAYAERRLSGSPDGVLVLPDTVHATVLARLDGLPERERTVLQYGAVVGRTVRAGAIATVLSDLTLEEIVQTLERLAERDMLVPRGADTFAFRHIVIREVAYATLSRADRVRSHARVAQWLEERIPTEGEQLIELVAYQYRQAISLAPAGSPLPPGLELPRVVGALERAARLAWATGAFPEAAEQLREAIRLSPPEDHLRLYEVLGDVMQFGDIGIEGYREAYGQWRALSGLGRDPSQGLRLLRKLLYLNGRWYGSIRAPLSDAEFDRLLAEGRALAGEAPDAEEEARLDLAEAFSILGRRVDRDEEQVLLSRGLARAERARSLLAETGDRNAESEALDALAAVHRRAGRWEEAAGVTRARLAHAGELNRIELFDAWNVLAWDLTYVGRFRQALEAVEEARRALRPGEPDLILSHGWAWAALAARLVGDWDATLHLCDRLRTI